MACLSGARPAAEAAVAIGDGEWRQALPGDPWTRLTVRDGEQGLVEIELGKCRVQTQLERKRTGPAEWLVITRRPLSDDRTLETQASRDACDQDTRYGYRYYLTPHIPHPVPHF